jgi:Arc/MetJ family transcription regulator
MRTTIELNEEDRARLLELAARRGLKGFSAIVHEALDTYFKTANPRPRPNDLIEKYRGSIPKEEADHMRRVAHRLRHSWR